jgi:hypothetical protein
VCLHSAAKFRDRGQHPTNLPTKDLIPSDSSLSSHRVRQSTTKNISLRRRLQSLPRPHKALPEQVSPQNLRGNGPCQTYGYLLNCCWLLFAMRGSRWRHNSPRKPPRPSRGLPVSSTSSFNLFLLFASSCTTWPGEHDRACLCKQPLGCISR